MRSLLLTLAVSSAFVSTAHAREYGETRGRVLDTFGDPVQGAEIRIGGEVVTVDGEPVGFNDPELWPELDVADAKGAVMALVGTDADVLTIATELMTEAGFTGRDDDEDPT